MRLFRTARDRQGGLAKTRSEALAKSVPDIENLLSHGGAILFSGADHRVTQASSSKCHRVRRARDRPRITASGNKTLPLRGPRKWFESSKSIAMLWDRPPDGQKETPKKIKRKKLYTSGEDNHQSIWKLAYADFMTAMMAFFLVMWLINSTPREKLVLIANYFNPIKLSDPTPFRPGLSDPKRAGNGKDQVSGAKPGTMSGEHGGRPISTLPKQTEEDTLFQNPFPVLSRLASQAEAARAAAKAGELTGSRTSHDPFATDYIIGPLMKWIATAWRYETGLDPDAAAPRSSKSEAETAGGGMPGNAAAPLSPEAEADAAREQKLANTRTEPRSAEEQRQLAIQKGAAQVEKELAELIGTFPQTPGPNITVKAVLEGILISLTDDTKFNMFKISSAVPSPELVYFLEKMGSIVNKHPGKIIVRGHTDGRPHAGDLHGNWRLSVNRATATYYMLMRGNVGDSRFFALEGYAERDLRNKANPLAGENRRIEILIRVAEEP